MRLGLFGINMYVGATDPSAAVRVAVAAEAAGWESVWTGEHYVLPNPRVPQSLAPPDTPMLDPFVSLALIAGRTTTLRLGTGVTVVPVHQPLILAKHVASLDRASGGRFLFGIGVGYLEPELRALGATLADRGARTTDAVAAMRALWSGATAYEGPHVSFSAVRAEPRPRDPLGPPIHVGGHAPQSFRRAVAIGHGWYGFGLGLEATEKAIAGLRRAAGEQERPPELGELEISVTPDPRLPLDAATIAAFADLGVTRLIVNAPREAQRDADALVRFVEDHAPA
ncbi:MAG TPA: TIGR03619 family F420-dependent LLM class oxidoreductase [Acidimicrobiales bacterium]